MCRTGGGPGRSADPRARLRHLPHRPARRRGGAAPATLADHPRPSDRRRGRRARPGPGAAGADHGLTLGQRVGVAWLHRTCGRCRFCRSGRENLCTVPSSPAGPSTAATPSCAPRARTSSTRCPTASPTRGGAAAVRGHHRLPRAAADRDRRLGAARAWASTASAPPVMWRCSWRAGAAPRSTCARAIATRHQALATSWARRGPATRSTRRRCRWTRRSSSHPRARWCRPRCAH